MTKKEKGHHFFEEKNRVTASVTAPGDTKISDATPSVGHAVAITLLRLLSAMIQRKIN